MAALVLVLIASGRIAATYTVFNHTADEPAHIASGMEWLDKHAYTYEPQHPPLARAAAALGPYLLGVRSQGTPGTGLEAETLEGVKILYRDHHYDLTLALARLGILPFFWLACGVIYFWGKRFYGATIAVIAVFFFSFLPPILAHAGLATTDTALTASLAAAYVSGLIWVERPTWRHGLLFGACSGMAAISKFSSLAYFPAAIAVALAGYLVMERPSLSELRRAIQQRLPSLALAMVAGALVIAAAYRFSPAPLFAGVSRGRSAQCRRPSLVSSGTAQYYRLLVFLYFRNSLDLRDKIQVKVLRKNLSYRANSSRASFGNLEIRFRPASRTLSWRVAVGCP